MINRMKTRKKKVIRNHRIIMITIRINNMKKKTTVRKRMNSKLNNQTKIMTVSLILILMKSRMMI